MRQTNSIWQGSGLRDQGSATGHPISGLRPRLSCETNPNSVGPFSAVSIGSTGSYEELNATRRAEKQSQFPGPGRDGWRSSPPQERLAASLRTRLARQTKPISARVHGSGVRGQLNKRTQLLGPTEQTNPIGRRGKPSPKPEALRMPAVRGTTAPNEANWTGPGCLGAGCTNKPNWEPSAPAQGAIVRNKPKFDGTGFGGKYQPCKGL
jgi:hypothetical protein